MPYLLLTLCGLLSGFLAGLLGIGGGLIVVPSLLYLLPLFGIEPASLSQVAVATSLAAMVPTAGCAAWRQRSHGGLDFEWLMRLAPGVALGALVASSVATRLDGRLLSLALALLMIPLAGRIFCLQAAAPASSSAPGASRIAALPAWVVGAAIGMLSTLAGLGGANFTVSYLLAQRLGMHRAVGTSSGVVLVLACVGAAGFATSHPSHPLPGSGLVGMVCVPAAALVSLGAVAAAPGGARCSHRLGERSLRHVFAALMLTSATAVLIRVLH
jgi:uncharacterized membrane protein YfcA